jgi:hypothetical protein
MSRHRDQSNADNTPVDLVRAPKAPKECTLACGAIQRLPKQIARVGSFILNVGNLARHSE